MTDTWFAFHGRVPVFFFVDPSETFSRDTEPYKLGQVYGSGVSEGSTEKENRSGKELRITTESPYNTYSTFSLDDSVR